MDGNKDEALRCLKMAEESIASGNRDRALKFIKIASRLNPDLPFHHLRAACEDIPEGPTPSATRNFAGKDEVRVSQSSVDSGTSTSTSSSSYSEEQVELIRRIKRTKDYYGILGVEKSCSVEEIRKAYKKLSLRVHPDKNKAPGSDEAFKIVSRAFKCLSDGDSRRDYDRYGFVDWAGPDSGGYASGRRPVRRRRRRGSSHEFYYDDGDDDDFDPDEIFRTVFGQSGVFRTRNVYRSRSFGGGGDYREEFQGGGRGGGGGPNLILLLQILPFLLIFALAYLPFLEPDYSLHRNYTYQVSRITEKHGVEFFVKSSSFDETYPVGSPARAKIEDSVIKDYRSLLWRYCHAELQRRHWNENFPTPHCNKLNNLGTA